MSNILETSAYDITVEGSAKLDGFVLQITSDVNGSYAYNAITFRWPLKFSLVRNHILSWNFPPSHAKLQTQRSMLWL